LCHLWISLLSRFPGPVRVGVHHPPPAAEWAGGQLRPGLPGPRSVALVQVAAPGRARASLGAGVLVATAGRRRPSGARTARVVSGLRPLLVLRATRGGAVGGRRG